MDWDGEEDGEEEEEEEGSHWLGGGSVPSDWEGEEKGEGEEDKEGGSSEDGECGEDHEYVVSGDESEGSA